MPAKPVAGNTFTVISSAGKFAEPVPLPFWSDGDQISSCPKDSSTFQKDICYISLFFFFYLCDLVKIKTTANPHLFLFIYIFFHFSVILTYFLSFIEVWSSGHSLGPGHWPWCICTFNRELRLITEHRVWSKKRFTRQMTTIVRRKPLYCSLLNREVTSFHIIYPT